MFMKLGELPFGTAETIGWAKLNGANAVSFVEVKHVLENFDNF